MCITKLSSPINAAEVLCWKSKIKDIGLFSCSFIERTRLWEGIEPIFATEYSVDYCRYVVLPLVCAICSHAGYGGNAD